MKMKANKPEDCRRFEECSAPLCPLDENLRKRVWFADEPICRSKNHGGGRQWMVSQRKVKKKSADPTTCYTLEMLDRHFIVKKGIVGVDPDSKDFPGAVRKWIQQRPEIDPGQTKERQLRAGIMRKKYLSEQGVNAMT
jgi:hypothetical protein